MSTLPVGVKLNNGLLSYRGRLISLEPANEEVTSGIEQVSEWVNEWLDD